jgi:hypothetical protein
VLITDAVSSMLIFLVVPNALVDLVETSAHITVDGRPESALFALVRSLLKLSARKLSFVSHAYRHTELLFFFECH